MANPQTQSRTSSGYPAPAKQESRGRPFTIVSAICAVVAVAFLPIIFGPVGAVFGFVAYGRGDRKGLWAGIASIICTFLGLLIAVLVIHANHH